MKKILIACLACLFLASCATNNNDSSNNNNNNVPSEDLFTNDNFIPSDFNNIYGVNEGEQNLSNFELNYDATVRIRANYDDGQGNKFDQASGFVYSKKDNNYYVITSASHIASKKIIKGQVKLDYNGLYEFAFNDGRKYRGTIVGDYPGYDIAVFKITTPDYLPVAVIGSSDQLKIGQEVGAIGSPDVQQDLLNSYVRGVVSGLNRRSVSHYNGIQIGSFSTFQFDAPTNVGMQGGTVLNEKDEVIGIIANKQVNNNLYESLSFAIAIDDVKNMVDSIIETGTYDKLMLGITAFSLDFLNKDRVKWPYEEGVYNGVFITEVSSGSKAEQAGVKQSTVIVACTNKDGKKININSMEEFQSQLIRLSSGDSITLYLRHRANPILEEVTISL